jgi:hypothetical protein
MRMCNGRRNRDQADMTLDEYCALLRAEVEAFRREWEDLAILHPEIYPLDQEEGDWFEHFIRQAIAA